MTNADGDFGLRGKGRTAESRNRFPTVSIRARREYRRDCHFLSVALLDIKDRKLLITVFDSTVIFYFVPMCKK